MSELERVRHEYARRKQDARYSERYSTFNAADVFILQERERVLLQLLRCHLRGDWTAHRILDAGCGHGHVLAKFVAYGVNHVGLNGIDLLPDRVQMASAHYPMLNFACGNVAALPFTDSTFELVLQFTMFTSVLDNDLRHAMASEMLRVLKPNGFIVWYDYRWNPINHQVRGIGIREIQRLFPDCSYDIHRITLAPPLTRLIVPRSWLLGAVLSAVPLLRTHYLIAIQKRQ